ncbi:MAG: alcohol dehydrogenase catalytic domain-containing protein [Chloroflexota bacterium]|nr:alcohol dehydrogenase catalytic domain-containing protein [Chloroflexota bacterium]
MQRAVFLGEGRITVEQALEPQPGPGEVLVRVHTCTLCGSDRGMWERGSSVTPGHEVAGTVVEVGPGASLPAGSRGAVFLVAYCGECGMCGAGSRGACLRKEGMIGFDRDGGYAEYVAVPERCFLPVDDRLDLDDAAMLLDATGTAMHALRRAGALHSRPSSALVMGAGPVGLGVVLALRAVGVGSVLAVDIASYRLEFARRLGATPIPGGEGAFDAVRAVLPGGPPLVIEASGNPAAQRQALDLLAPGGRLVIVGHSRKPLELWTSRDLIQQEKTLLGSEYFDPAEFEPNEQLVLQGKLAPRELITHRMDLGEIEEAYRLFWAGETGKVLLYPGGTPNA